MIESVKISSPDVNSREKIVFRMNWSQKLTKNSKNTLDIFLVVIEKSFQHVILD